MTKFLHLSDLHSHFPKSLKGFKGTVLITGDIMDDGAEFEYNRAYHRLYDLGKDALSIITPGNHDYGLRGNIPDHESISRFDILSGMLQNHHYDQKKIYIDKSAIDKWILLGLNSCRMDETIKGFAQGEFGERQLTDLSLILEEQARPDYQLIIMFHHHPFWDSRFSKLRDAKKFLAIVKKFKNRYKHTTLLFGHQHVKGEFNIAENIKGFAAPATWMNNKALQITIDNGNISFGEKVIDLY